MRPIEELKQTTSDYLCTECKNPLYFEIESKEEVCVNPKCKLFPPLLKFHDIRKAEQLRAEMKEREGKLRAQIVRTDRKRFLRYLYEQRMATIRDSFTKRRMDFQKLLALDGLLTWLNTLRPIGRQWSEKVFRSILNNYKRFFDYENLIDDIQNLRVLISTKKKTYLLKYWTAILELYRSYGIVAGGDFKASGVFKYSEIDKEAKEDVEFKLGEDMGKFLEQFFDHITAMKYALEMYHRTSMLHNYDPSGLDIAVLLGLFFSCKEDVEAWSIEGIRRHFDQTAKAAGIEASFNEFVHEYITNPEKAPILVFDSRSYLFDRYATFFYSLYLIGRHQRKTGVEKDTGSRRIMLKKQKSSEIFEDRIRKRLSDCGFTVLPKPLKVTEQNESYEFDVMGVNGSSRELVLVEAKYRDFSPSSLTGKTLIQQELLDEESGLLVEAIKQQKRLKFFRRHDRRFRRELSLKFQPDEYSVSAYVVTKHPPVIAKYRQVSVVVYDKFCEQFKV